jgi:hypothetical protein
MIAQAKLCTPKVNPSIQLPYRTTTRSQAAQSPQAAQILSPEPRFTAQTA